MSSIFRADNDYEKRLPREKLYTLVKHDGVVKYVKRADYAFYQALVEVLIPDVLRPIPSKFIKLYLFLSKIGSVFTF